MRYSLPEISKKYPHEIGRMLASGGKITTDQMFIDVPDDFKFTDTIKGAGDLVAILAQPIAKGIDKVFNTNISNCGGCKQRQNTLNEWIPL